MNERKSEFPTLQKNAKGEENSRISDNRPKRIFGIRLLDSTGRISGIDPVSEAFLKKPSFHTATPADLACILCKQENPIQEIKLPYIYFD